MFKQFCFMPPKSSYLVYAIIIGLSILSSALTHADSWKPFSMPWNKAPVNLSFLLDPPAGKHGFLGVEDNRFIFEDGTEIRFWGTTMIGSACFPPQELAPDIAERLSRFGINLVRFQHMDAEWVEPNLFADEQKTGTLFNVETFDRLDYFLFQLKNRGIYAFFDGLDLRTLKPEDRIPEWQAIPPGFGEYIHFSRSLQIVHRDYLLSLWSHRNRYTDREYRDSPMIVMTQLFYNNHFKPGGSVVLPYKIELYDQWQQWWGSRNQKSNKDKKDQPKNQSQFAPKLNLLNPTKEMQLFLEETEEQSNIHLKNYLRSIRVKCPISGTGQYDQTLDLPIQLIHDFITIRGFWNFPLNQLQWYANQRMTDANLEQDSYLFSELAFARLKEKPMVISEWGHPWPNDYRTELPVWMAAMACFQDWNGCISFGYRTFHDTDTEHIFAPLETFNDPCIFGLFPAASLTFHQHSIAPAQRTAQMVMNKDYLLNAEPVSVYDARPTRLATSMKVEVDLNKRASGSLIFAPTEPEEIYDSKYRPSKNAELIHDQERGLVLIDSLQTQGVIGHLNRIQNQDLSFLYIETDQNFGVICVNSIDGESIPDSKDLLLTIVSEARNTNFITRRENNGYLLQNAGESPVLLKDTPARIFLRTKHDNWTIKAIDGTGTLKKTLPFQIQNKTLSFRAGIHGTLYYRLSCNTNDENN